VYGYIITMAWTVVFSNRASKQVKKLSANIYASIKFLVKDIQEDGPIVPQWPNFSKITGKSECYHCHIRQGRPTYVAVWQVIDREIEIVEIRYVGTHEGADYRRVC
jgi:mRNA-degrading endonuclease RelE of RelBE toxin-antitoxin system